MKNTKFRRRALLSSVAMLLVALVALGSATFAWFTSSTTTTADGITVRTSKTSELQISDDTIAYTAAGFTYSGLSSVMVPASSANGKDWFYTNAANKSAFTAANTSEFTAVPSENKNKYVYINQLNIKNAGEVAVNNISITISNFSTGAEYLKVALVPVSAKVTGGDTTMTAANFVANIYGKTSATAPSNTTYYPVTSATAISATAITPKTTDTITISDPLAAGQELHYNLFVWFEGQDAKCFDGKAGQGVTNLSFTVAGTPVSES